MDGDDDDAFLYGGDVPATTRSDAPAQPQQPAGAVLEADAVAPPDGAPQAEPQLEQAAAEEAQDEEDSDEEDEDSDSVSRHAVSSAWPPRRAAIATAARRREDAGGEATLPCSAGTSSGDTAAEVLSFWPTAPPTPPLPPLLRR